ncbi:MAG: histidine kinase dimerization/phospho-acceptor domain-containing protein [Polyangiaceae bacterium]|nr:histidine kinase dimerization/phospho-acceptor domain-containing protein [Polyangiaceae bacterium]
MSRLVVVAVAAIGLILFVAFVIARLVRTRTRGMSIRMQVFLALAFIVGTFSLGLGLLVLDRIEARAVRVATFAAEEQAKMIAAIIEGDLERSRVAIERVARRLEVGRQPTAELRLELLDTSGHLLFPSGAKSAEGTPGTVSYDAPVKLKGRNIGVVRVVKPTLEIRRLLADLAPTVLVISLVLGAAAALAAAWIGRAIAQPIEALSDFAESVSLGERTQVPNSVFGREVKRLVQSIDSMRRQLEGRPFVETFAADLSHELKNPVAAILASAEVLEEGAIDEPTLARQFVGRIREAASRIDRLLRDLVSLARIEARGVEALGSVDMAGVTRSVVEALGDAQQRVEFVAMNELCVRGDESWLGRAVFNLVDNALVHSATGARVRVRVQREEGGVLVAVTNPGAISKHVRGQLFRRFVTTRADKGGSGLGLAIARAVAEAHGGRLELQVNGPPDVTFGLWLPDPSP